MKIKEITNLTDLVSFKGNSKIERKAMFIGLVSSTILSKELFKKNEDLKEYTDIFRDNNSSSFKDYIFASRTQVIAKVQRFLLETLTDDNFDNIINKHVYYIEKKNIEIKNTKYNENKKVNSEINRKKSLIEEMYKNRLRNQDRNDN
ncbi:hypothetical protein [Exiguobacterium sp. RIT594]|uniref:hypothetical protein n=1 Tax=Exiguobacterium sp. RIT594 TaxID=2282449 RepID=UPI000DF8216D|nr:hypothetical protein [Exiguobacterium sp. RIT594]RDB32002.1 hypothetical protein DVG79_15505 [Exiguobacterium sp. RIT594]